MHADLVFQNRKVVANPVRHPLGAAGIPRHMECRAKFEMIASVLSHLTKGDHHGRGARGGQDDPGGRELKGSTQERRRRGHFPFPSDIPGQEEHHPRPERANGS